MRRIPKATESFIRPGLYTKKTSGKGVGVFCKVPLYPGELIGIMAGGKIWTREEVRARVRTWGDYFHQVSKGFHWGPKHRNDVDILDRLNHSCDPNVVIFGEMSFYTRERIGVGEELVWDYATTESDPEYGFRCRCGSKLCRRVMNGNDWKLPELQTRYAGHFAPYLEKKIQEQRRAA